MTAKLIRKKLTFIPHMNPCSMAVLGEAAFPFKGKNDNSALCLGRGSGVRCVTLCLLHWVDSINLLAVSASFECSISDYKRHNVKLSPRRGILKKSGPTTCKRFQVSSFLSGVTHTVQQLGGRAYLNAPPKTNLLTLKSPPVACQGASLEQLHAAPGTHSGQ